MQKQRTLWTLLGLTFVGFVTASDALAQEAQDEDQAKEETVVVSQAREGVTLTVRNDNWADMKLYVVRLGTRYRLGTVNSFQSVTYDLPTHLQADISELQLLAVPIGGTRSVLSPIVYPSAGDEVVWGLQNNLALSGTIVS